MRDDIINLDDIEKVEDPQIEPDDQEQPEDLPVEPEDQEQPEDLPVEPDDQEPTEEIEIDPKEEFDPELYQRKLQMVKDILNLVGGGEEPSARVSPILSPKEKRTSSKLSRGEIEMCLGLVTFYQISPSECFPALDYVYDKLMLNLSLDGYGIERAIDLGRALTQRDTSTKYVEEPTKPTNGMKNK